MPGKTEGDIIIDNELLDISRPDHLQFLYEAFYPRGSGPLGMMRIVCKLLEAIAEEKDISLRLPQRLES